MQHLEEFQPLPPQAFERPDLYICPAIATIDEFDQGIGSLLDDSNPKDQDLKGRDPGDTNVNPKSPKTIPSDDATSTPSDETLPDVKVSLTFHLLDKFPSFVEILFTLMAPSDNKKDTNTLSKFSVRLHSKNMDKGKMIVTEVKDTNKNQIAKFHKISPETFEALLAQTSSANETTKPMRLYELRIRHTKADWLCGLHSAIPERLHPTLTKALRQHFDKPGCIRFLILSYGIGKKVKALSQSFADCDLLNPADAWFKSQRHFLQKGEFVDADVRPKIQPSRMFTFFDFDWYMITLGYGIIEEYEREQELCDETQAEFTILTLPAQENAFLVFMSIMSEKRFQEGDVVLADFASEVVYDTTAWHAKVMQSSPFAPPETTTLLLRARRDEENEGKFLSLAEATTLDGEPIKIHQWEDLHSTEYKGCRQKINGLAKQACWIKPVHSYIPFDRQINALREITDKRPHTQKFLCATNIMDLPETDYFSKAPSDNRDAAIAIIKREFNTKQNEALEKSRCFRGPVLVVQGPGGTGKTHWITNMAAPHACQPRDVKYSSSAEPTTRPVLLLSASNRTVDDLACRALKVLEQRFKELGIKRSPMVVRLHSLDTEEMVTLKNAKKDLPRPQPAFDNSIMPELIEFSAIHQIYGDIQRQLERPNGIPDKRLKELELSCGYWMYRMSGLVPDDEFGADDETEFLSFCEGFKAIQAGNGLSATNKPLFRESMCKLREKVLKSADIVVTTASNAGMAQLYTVLTGTPAIIVDEGGCLPEPDCWAPLAWFEAPMILVGDTRQLHPQVDQRDQFYSQLSFPLMARMEAAGFESVMFEEQHRYHSDICGPVSKLFYDNKLITAKSTDARPSAIKFRSLLKETFKIERNVLLLACATRPCGSDATGSKFNRDLVVAGLHVLTTMINAGFEINDIAILTPYKAQQALYRQALTYLQKDLKKSLAGIEVETVDAFQGRECTYCILDLVRTDRLGFLAHRNRVNVAVTRAKDGLVILSDVKALAKIKNFGQSAVGRATTYLKEQTKALTVLNMNSLLVSEELRELITSADVEDRGFDVEFDAPLDAEFDAPLDVEFDAPPPEQAENLWDAEFDAPPSEQAENLWDA